MVAKKRGLRAALSRIFNGRRWNEVRTRKKMLIFSIIIVLLYTIIGIAMLWLDKVMDSTLTSEYFSYAKWLVGSGVAITLADKVSDTVKLFKSDEVTNDEDTGE